MKHVGKMKNNGARVAIVFRTLPGDPLSALVVGTNGLGDAYHDSLMSIIESDQGQQANELADVLSVRKFPDGTGMLEFMHTRGMLKKVPTAGVIVTPDNKTQVQLDELNELIANQKGIPLTELAVKDGSEEEVVIKEKAAPTKNKWDKAREDKAAAKLVAEEETATPFQLSPAEMRSRADALYKEAARLRKDADELDPPKKKAKAESSVA
jgi:hypothetical protein